MSVSFVWCGIMIVDLVTKLVKNAVNFQFANKALLFANKFLFLRTNVFICD
ncbi:hypothetical protein G3A_19320 [Bacillus sp. 17376]|nr:hypothetical protein G3A_19320 [Bacillus sp. 17376]